MARYPCKKALSNLPNNRKAALRSLYGLEKRLKENTSHAEHYKDQIADMLNRDVCRILSDRELVEYEGPKYYISHHHVTKQESKGTPSRIVLNSSANFEGHVLNDYYVKGPSMLNGLLGLLLRFCQRRIAIAGDISKMYHSVDIPHIDQMTHRFLWRNLDEEREPQTYVMKVVNFGDRPSGSIAIAALEKTDERSKDEFPEVSHIIQRNSYVNDILHSCETMEKANRIKDPINTILDRGGFNIADYVTRGKHPDDLKDGNLWQTGAKFLELPMDQWPVKQNTTLLNLPEQINSMRKVWEIALI